MMDITRKLELLVTMKTGDHWLDELGECSEATVSGIAAEALAEIQRLRQNEGYRSQGMYMLMPSGQEPKTVEWSAVNDPTIAPVMPTPRKRQVRVDILDRLKKAGEMRPGTANSDVNVYATPVSLTWGDVDAAVKEIERLRAHERASEKWLAELVSPPTFVMPQDWRSAVRSATIECDHQHQIIDASGAVYMGIKGWVRPELLPTLSPSEREQAEKTLADAWVPRSGTTILDKIDPDQLKPSTPNEPAPEPWGSPFAMNTENWK
jgi:hypothetical protein